MTRPEKNSLSISTESLSTDIEAKVAKVNNNFDITAVYGWHQTIDHASEVLDVVEPNSIVLVEGYMRDHSYAAMRLDQHIALADARLRIGSYDESLTGDCEALISEFQHRQHSPASEHDTYSHFLYAGLIDKGAIIFPADYLNLDDRVELYDASAARQKLLAMFPLESMSDVRAAIASELELIEKEAEVHQVREASAVNHALNFLSYYADFADLSSLCRSPNGKTQTYILFGLAHRHSLTSRFKELGVSMNLTLVNTSDTPTDELRDLSKEYISIDEERNAINEYYLGHLTVLGLEQQTAGPVLDP